MYSVFKPMAVERQYSSAVSVAAVSTARLNQSNSRPCHGGYTIPDDRPSLYEGAIYTYEQTRINSRYASFPPPMRHDWCLAELESVTWRLVVIGLGSSAFKKKKCLKEQKFVWRSRFGFFTSIGSSRCDGSHFPTYCYSRWLHAFVKRRHQTQAVTFEDLPERK